MMLLTKQIRKLLPKLYSQENVTDPVAQVRFFCPWNQWTWFATEFDGEDTFFGKVIGHETELGYFSLAEMQELTGPVGLKIERDLHFTPKPISECN